MNLPHACTPFACHGNARMTCRARRFGFVKYKTKEAATAALAKLGGRELADFPGQTVRSRPLAARERDAQPTLTQHCSREVKLFALPDHHVSHSSLCPPAQAAHQAPAGSACRCLHRRGCSAGESELNPKFNT